MRKRRKAEVGSGENNRRTGKMHPQEKRREASDANMPGRGLPRSVCMLRLPPSHFRLPKAGQGVNGPLCCAGHEVRYPLLYLRHLPCRHVHAACRRPDALTATVTNVPPAATKTPVSRREAGTLSSGAGNRHLWRSSRTAFKFTEGPAWNPISGPGWESKEPSLIFSDIPTSRLYRYERNVGHNYVGSHGSFSRGDRRAATATSTIPLGNALHLCPGRPARDRPTRGRYLGTTCPTGAKASFLPRRTMWSIKNDGTVWFTDPTYGPAHYARRSRPANRVYCYDPKTREPCAPWPTNFDQPNGLCFSPDETRLYVADSGKTAQRAGVRRGQGRATLPTAGYSAPSTRACPTGCVATGTATCSPRRARGCRSSIRRASGWG